MKVSELTGAELDFWVAKAEGKTLMPDGDGGWFDENGFEYSPSVEWADGGPIIQRNFIELAWNGDPSECKASWMHNNGSYSWQFGPEPLTAAMRCYVGAKYGEDVPD